MRNILVLLTIVLVVGGCITTPQPDLSSYTEEQRQAYEEWLAIDMDNLSPGLKRAMSRLDDESEFTDFDLDIISEYPWIDPGNLSERDKAFLARVGIAIGVVISAM